MNPSAIAFGLNNVTFLAVSLGRLYSTALRRLIEWSFLEWEVLFADQNINNNSHRIIACLLHCH